MAEAGGFAIREQSAYGQGTSFAGVAAGGSLSSMFWNPATLAGVSVFEVEGVISGIFPSADVDVLGPESLTVPPIPFPIPTGAPQGQGDIIQDAAVPAFYAAYRLSDRFVLGIGVNSPFGLITKYDADSILRDFGIAGTTDLFSINVNPAVSYQVNDWLAVGLGAQVQYIETRLTAQTLPGLGTGVARGRGRYGFGLTAGVLVTPLPGTEIGLGYRSFIDHETEGTATINGVALDATADGVDLPDTVTFGIRQRITDAFRVMAGVEWSNWSRFQEVELSTDAGGADLPFNYNDGWFFSVGGEYDVTQRIAVRAGVGYELSPIDDENRSYRVPDNDRLWLSAGASYKANDRVSVDLGYSYIIANDTELHASEDFGGDGPEANGPFFGEADSDVHIIAAAVKIKLGAMPADQPLITK